MMMMMMMMMIMMMMMFVVSMGEARSVYTVKPSKDSKEIEAAVPPGYDELYGYPSTIGGLIIEGPFPYKNGPNVWTPNTISGAYGLIDAAGDAKTIGGKCPPVPSNSPFANSTDVHPVQLTNGLTNCLLGCNLTKVKTTGIKGTARSHS